MNLIPLASSSKGNAYVVEHDGSAILIDCGIPYNRFKNIEVEAVLITHSHTDHVQGLRTFLKYRNVPVYANLMTAETVVVQEKVPADSFVCFENGQEFSIGSFTVSAFSIPHDTSDPVGYMVKAGGMTYFHGTDIGTALDSVGLKLAEADIATLESNHDLTMLRCSNRQPCLIQRIAGPRGHLSNDMAADLVRKFASPKLKKLFLAHLSRDCNAPNIAVRVMSEALREINRTDIELAILEP